MFFNTADFSVDAIEAYKLSWPSQDAVSPLRPFHALSLRVRGNARFIHGETAVAVRSGDIVFVPAYYRYRLVAGQEELFVLHFCSEAPLPQQIVRFSPTAPELYRQAFEALCTLFREKPAGYALECRAQFYRIAADLERDHREQETGGNDRLRKAVEYIHTHFTDTQLSVGALARCTGVSETYFRQLFAARFGETPVQYIQRLRLQYALELLRSGYYTVAQAADKSGFSSPYYFSAFVRRHTGRPPTAFVGASSAEK